MEKIIKVSGITCESCVDKISKNLFSLPEIENITIDITNSTITLELNDHIADDTIKSVLKASGKYEVIGIE